MPDGLEPALLSRYVVRLPPHDEAPRVENRSLILSWAKDEKERSFLASRLDGESMEVQAETLGHGDLPPGEQRGKVYRAIENFVRRMKRKWGK